MNKVFLLGNNPVTKAVAKGLNLFGVHICNDNTCNILLMADGDKYDFVTFRKQNFSDDCKLIYVRSSDRRADTVHPLCFLAEFYDTYRLSLDEFVIDDFVNCVGHICGWKGMVNYEGLTLGRLKMNSVSNSCWEETFQRLYDKYECLGGYSDSLVRSALHDIKHYCSIIEIETDLNKCIKNLSAMGVNKQLYSCINVVEKLIADNAIIEKIKEVVKEEEKKLLEKIESRSKTDAGIASDGGQ